MSWASRHDDGRKFVSKGNGINSERLTDMAVSDARRPVQLGLVSHIMTPELGEAIKERLSVRMREAIAMTDRDGKERGFSICENLTMVTILQGNSKRVRVDGIRPCKVVGFFHTHPNIIDGRLNSRNFSPTDLKTFSKEAYLFQCLGFKDVDGKYVVRCAGYPKADDVKFYEALYKTLADPKIMRRPDYDEILQKGTLKIQELGTKLTAQYEFIV